MTTQQPADQEEYWQDSDDQFAEPVCPRCHGDGADPLCDYIPPCPLCQGEQRP